MQKKEAKLRPDNTPTRDLTHTILLILAIGLLIAASFWILLPFLPSILWASLIVIAAWPLLERLESHCKKRWIAVALMTMGLLLVILVPVTLAVITIIENADRIAAQARSLVDFSLAGPPAWIERIPFAGERLAARWHEFASLSPDERSARVIPHVKNTVTWFMGQAGDIGMMIVQFLLTIIIAAILFAQGEKVESGVRIFARRLGGSQADEVTVLAAKAVRGVVLGVVLTALAQATIGGIGLIITGVPAPVLLTAIMFMLSLAQIGPFPVLIPAIIWLFWSGQPLWGAVLVGISAVAGTVDNVIRPILIRKGVDLPLLLIFSGVVGGLIAFGVVGLFVGPVVLAVTYTLLKAWATNAGQQK